jgi:transcription antitermination factor NusG
MITDYKSDGEEADTLYGMFEEDERRVKFFYPSILLVEMAMNMKAKDLIKGVPLHRGFMENATTSTQRLVKIKIKSVEYVTD